MFPFQNQNNSCLAENYFLILPQHWLTYTLGPTPSQWGLQEFPPRDNDNKNPLISCDPYMDSLTPPEQTRQGTDFVFFFSVCRVSTPDNGSAIPLKESLKFQSLPGQG